jgi:hypothetical protein
LREDIVTGYECSKEGCAVYCKVGSAYEFLEVREGYDDVPREAMT